MHLRATHLAAALALWALVPLAPLAPLAAQLVPVGPERAVNTTTAGSQFAAGVAGEPGGAYLVVWQSTGQDGGGAGIYARLFDGAGSALTSEIHVSQTTAGDQVTPAVAWSPAGTFLVAWASNGQDGSGFGIYARRLQAATGQFLGNEFQVHVTTAGSQLAPRVAASGANFYAVWSGLGAGGDTNDIYGRGFTAAGSGAGAVTGEVRLNASVSGNQVQPAIAAAGSGLVVAWASDGADGSGFGVVARRFDGALAALSPEIPVPEHTIYDQSSPAVAGFASGGFAVAWQRALQEIGSTIGPQPVIALRRFTANAASGPELQVQTAVTRRHELPSLVGDGEEALTVAWQEHDLATGDKQVAASRYDGANTPLVVEFPLSSTTAGDQIAPALAGSARLVATWASFGQDGSSFGVYARRFGVPLPGCVADATTLCLNDGRFRIRASYATAAGASGAGQAVALTPESGYYWFFDDANVEIVIKVVDACGLAGFDNFWVFATGLTNVEVTFERRRHLDRRPADLPQQPESGLPTDPRLRALRSLRRLGAIRSTGENASEGWLDRGLPWGPERASSARGPHGIRARQDPERRRAADDAARKHQWRLRRRRHHPLPQPGPLRSEDRLPHRRRRDRRRPGGRPDDRLRLLLVLRRRQRRAGDQGHRRLWLQRPLLGLRRRLDQRRDPPHRARHPLPRPRPSRTPTRSTRPFAPILEIDAFDTCP